MKKITIMLLAMYFGYCFAYNAHTYIPARAFEYKDIIQTEITNFMPDLVEYNYVPALIEHESCISLTHKRCWSPTSQLKTKREEGAGLSQITRAYRADGTVRFDKLKEMRDNYRQELSELTWQNVYTRPELQIRALTLMIKEDNKKLREVKDETERLNFVDAAYNGGVGGVFKEMRACGIASGCNPYIWFSNVEKYCMKSKKILYGSRSACDINRAHTTITITEKLPKYKKYFKLLNLTKGLP